MSSSVLSRPLPLIPFIAADAVLLLTAMVIAWRAPDELAGGALLAVVVCVGLGAVLAVLPFVLNDAREREAALAERQRELVELVNTSTASATRWGTQWAAAATGLEDAAGLASRSIAAAERLPIVFQERADALTAQLAQAEREAVVRLEKSLAQEVVMVAREERLGAMVTDFKKTLEGFSVTAEQVKAARVELDQRVAEMPAQTEAHVEQVTRAASEAEARLGATTGAINQRLAEVEMMIGELVAKLERVAAMPAPASVVVPAPAAVVVEEPVVVKEPMVAPITSVVPVVEKPKVVVSSEAIMDPFLIPDDGYASLAEAMDARKS